MGLFGKFCGLCDRPLKRCHGHTTNAALADPELGIREYQSKPDLRQFRQKLARKGR